MDQSYGPNGMMMNPGQAVDGLRIYVAASLNAGININAADITIGAQAINQMPFTANTFNWSAGRLAGWTTRYGINPVPGHNSTEDGPVITQGALKGYPLRNIVAAEQAQAAHPYPDYDVYQLRSYILGAIIIALPVGTNNSTVPMLYWMSVRSNGSAHRFDLVPSTEKISGGQQMGLRSHLEAPVGGGTAIISTGSAVNPSGGLHNAPEFARAMQAIDRLGVFNLRDLRDITPAGSYDAIKAIKYVRYAVLQSSISTNMYDAVSLPITTGPGGTTTPYNAYFSNLGAPFWLTSTVKKNKSISFSVLPTTASNPKKIWSGNCFLSQNSGDLNYTSQSNRSVNIFSPSAAEIAASGQLLYAGVSKAYITTGTNGGSTFYYSQYGEQSVNIPISVVGIIANKPIISLWNPYLRDSSESLTTADNVPVVGGNDFVQWIDPSKNIFSASPVDTLDTSNSATAYYTEQGDSGAQLTKKQTCWGCAPVYAFPTKTANVINTVGGILANNTTYEYAFSVYNILTGKESNVGSPARAFTGAAPTSGGIAIQVKTAGPNAAFASQIGFLFPGLLGYSLGGTTPSMWYSQCIYNSQNYVSGSMPINYLFYRLYFREVGSFEWLSAGQYSFADVYANTNNNPIYIGVNNSGAAGVGGQPGGFNDFSDLPTDEYIDVASFQGRMFWLTRGQLCWSRSDDLLSYPALNFAGAPAGEFRGMLPHFFSGQAQQNGRIVVFSSNGNFEGRFTGNLIQQQVRVSPTAQPQAVYVDGSDFVLSQRGSETALSGRSAVVAEGVLFFMGPTGIYRDDGVALPKRISQDIEPLVFESYDKTTTDEFFAYYNRRSGEILFFYRPDPNRPDLNPQGYLTKAWVYSLRTESFGNPSDLVDFKGQTVGDNPGAWSQYGYNQLIDWAQDLDLTRFETVPHAPGVRTLIGSRRAGSATVSRPYYHDDDCSGGDYRPGDEMMIKEIQRPDAATVRFILAGGYSATILAAIAVGTKIAIQNSTVYGDMPTAANVDGYFVVKAKGAGYVDIEASGSLPAVAAQTFTPAQYFPMFVDGFHGVNCVMQTHYLAPEGIFTWHALRWLHILIKPVPTQQGSVIPYVTAKWEANHQQVTSTATKNLNLLALNTRETTTQIMTDIPSNNMEAQGQAVRTTLTYNQLAGRWTFYMVAGYYESAPNDTKMYQREYG